MQGELQRRLSDAVFTGVLDRDAIADTFASSDVFLFPSRADPAGNVVLEAQACGLPVLVTNVGGPQENLVDGETGHVIRDMAPNSWASALTPLLRQAERRAQMGAAARAYAEPLTWASALEPLFSAYRDLAVGVAGEATRPDLIAAPRR
jgi:glycosyltransferase involved in cell wall biosynthesis